MRFNDVNYCTAWTVRSLLELGANIGMKNHWDEVPITHIQPETMEEFLNEFW
jgi:hypothetical protein